MNAPVTEAAAVLRRLGQDVIAAAQEWQRAREAFLVVKRGHDTAVLSQRLAVAEDRLERALVEMER